ncbi:armadillo-type protein [Mycena leptocephala]|nr:armadillo-type protein [Mycena leptocephala]
MQKDLVSNRSSMLDEFRASGKGGTWHLRDIAGYIVELSRDQHGSRFIQTELPNASSEERQSVFDEIKLFEHGTQVQKTMLANTMEGHVFYLSCNLYGRRAVQKAIESILPGQQPSFVRELEPHILRCVIQKMIERVSPDRLGFVSTFIGDVFELASHPFGYRVLRRCLDHLPDMQTRPLLDELLANHVPHLMQDQFGYYVIQFILEHGRRPEDKAPIHKFASNMCEKALINADSESRRALIEEIMAPAPTPHAATPIVIMTKDQYGNYVLQRALGVAEGDQKETLINTVRPQLLSMRRYLTAYSKRLTSIEHELEPLSPSEPAR